MTQEKQLTRVELKAPYLIFLGAEPDKKHAKTGADPTDFSTRDEPSYEYKELECIHLLRRDTP